jgi:hypothetical protein
VPLLECRDAQLGTTDCDAAQPIRRTRKCIEHSVIVAAISAWLHKDTAGEAEAVEQGEIVFERRVIWRVAARLRIGKARGRTKRGSDNR